MKKAIPILLFLCAVPVVGWFILTSSESRAIGKQVSQWYDSVSKGETLDTEFKITDVTEGPDALSGLTASIQWQSPARLKIETLLDEEPIIACRNGNGVWIYQPKKEFAIVGSNEVPRFTADPESIENVQLPEMKLSLPKWHVKMLPLVLRVEKIKGTKSISLSSLGKKFTDLPDFSLFVTSGKEVNIKVPDSAEFSLEVEKFNFVESGDWDLPKDAEPHAEKVALSHIERCARILIEQIDAKTPTLPPFTGTRKVVASSGKGRLEDHDGVRVLFLEGSPEEMGTQQGELLNKEVHAVTDRILYGVGVGSSFAKGRWFFGEIEEAQSRIQKFTDDTFLREMDALADATGMHRQETRLSNFFPELFHCSGFALHGAATQDGKMYHGRILDYIRGAGLEDNAVVAICKPDGANAWVNVTYAGFVGSVTAMNEKHVAIGEMGGRGEGNWDGKPMAQLVREVMEQCDTIDEAVELMRKGPRTCEYYYVISDGKSGRAVGIKATPEIFETVWSGESHPQLPDPVEDTVLLSAGDRYTELVKRVRNNYGKFDADSARELMTRPVCMKSNIQSVLFAPESLDFWVANSDSENVASHTRYTKFNLSDLLNDEIKFSQAR